VPLLNLVLLRGLHAPWSVNLVPANLGGDACVYRLLQDSPTEAPFQETCSPARIIPLQRMYIRADMYRAIAEPIAWDC
jgi:hypothetical protein